MHKFAALMFTLVASAIGKPSHLSYSAPFAVAHSSQVLARHYNGIAAPLVGAPAVAPVPYAVGASAFAPVPYAVAAPPAIAAVPHPVAALHAHPAVHHASVRYAGLPHTHAHIAPYAAGYHGLAGLHHGVASLPYTGLSHSHLGHSLLPHAHISHTALAQTHLHPYAQHCY